MERRKGMKRSRQTVRDREPNKARVHDVVPDDPLDNPSRATNHPPTRPSGMRHRACSTILAIYSFIVEKFFI